MCGARERWSSMWLALRWVSRRVSIVFFSQGNPCSWLGVARHLPVVVCVADPSLLGAAAATGPIYEHIHLSRCPVCTVWVLCEAGLGLLGHSVRNEEYLGKHFHALAPTARLT